MLALIHFFIELCLLRKAPQDLPASGPLFGVTLVADLLVGLLLAANAGYSLGSGVAQSLVDILLMLALLYGGLRMLNRGARFAQAATALLGSGVVLGLVALLPISLIAAREPTGQSSLAAWLFLLLVAWSVLVTGHILRHAFDILLGQGAAIAVAYNVLAYTLARGLFPGP